MKKAWQIFKRDLGRLLHNPVALVITIGVCIIPSLYAWYNVVANWDPYSNTGNVKVAVVNEDRGVENDLVGSLNAGDEVEDQLRENDQLGWTFVKSEDDAREGVERGDYYAAIIVPGNFSENLTSMLTGSFRQPKITYYVNEKRSAIAPKVTDAGASTIEEQVNQTFVQTVTETVVEKLQEAGADVQGKGDELGDSLLSTIRDTDGDLGQIRTSLSDATGTIDTTKQAIKDADGTLEGLSDAIPSLTSALAKSNDLLGTARQAGGDFGTSLSTALSKGSAALGQASSDANAAVGKVTGSINAATGIVDGAVSNIDGTTSDLDALIKQLEGQDWIDDTARLETIASLKKVRDALAGTSGDLSAQSEAIKATSSSIAGLSNSMNTAVQSGSDVLARTQANLGSNVMPRLSSGLDSFSSVSAQLSGVLAGLKPAIASARGTMGQLDATLDQAKTALAQTDDTLSGIQTSLGKAQSDIEALRSSDALDAIAGILGVDASDVGDFLSAPVKLDTKTIYPVATYGSGVAPFYTNLALWVGGFVLIAIFKQEVDTEGVGSYLPIEGYFGRWLLLVLLGAVQAVIVCVGDLVIGLQNTQPALFVLAGVWISFVYVNIIYAFAITFKHIGKALAVIMVIVQIPGSSGMYPIEMMPAFYRVTHPLMPFTYGINAMRETIAGMYGADFWIDLAILAAFLVVALCVGTLLRPLFLNLNLLFDRHLSSTGVMLCEENDQPNRRFRFSALVSAMVESTHYRKQLMARAARFEHRYPALIKGGFLLVFGVPVVLFVLTATLKLDVDGKLLMLCLWILAVILADTYMIVVEYLRESIQQRIHASSLVASAGAGVGAGGAATAMVSTGTAAVVPGTATAPGTATGGTPAVSVADAPGAPVAGAAAAFGSADPASMVAPMEPSAASRAAARHFEWETVGNAPENGVQPTESHSNGTASEPMTPAVPASSDPAASTAAAAQTPGTAPAPSSTPSPTASRQPVGDDGATQQLPETFKRLDPNQKGGDE